ncbi:MAG: PDZ domain-containing protein, partial [Acidobacteria bacterium]|nr:PDZ domain-containing protein [Acidobacteriota bacterium]
AKYTRLAARAEGGRVMVLVGSGHLLYNIGINWRVYKKDPAPFKTVLCIAIPEGETQVTVQRSLADYIMGIPEEEKPVYPSDGIALKKFDGLDNPVIERDPITGVAKGQDFKKGDVVLAVDGTSYTSINALRTYMSRFNWGDSVTFKLLREAKEITVTLKYEMSPEEAEEANLTACFRM